MTSLLRAERAADADVESITQNLDAFETKIAELNKFIEVASTDKSLKSQVTSLRRQLNNVIEAQNKYSQALHDEVEKNPSIRRLVDVEKTQKYREEQAKAESSADKKILLRKKQRMERIKPPFFTEAI